MDTSVHAASEKLQLGLGLSQFFAIILAHVSGWDGLIPSLSCGILAAV